MRNDMSTTILQYFYNKSVAGCYCWVKKVISVLNSNLNQ